MSHVFLQHSSSLEMPIMEPSFTPEDERLLVAIRAVIRERGEGTWEDTTAIYNRLVPSRIEQRLPTLMVRYRTITQRTGHMTAGVEDAKVRAEVERLLAEAVCVRDIRAYLEQS